MRLQPRSFGSLKRIGAPLSRLNNASPVSMASASGSGNEAVEDYSKWSNVELVKRVTNLEAQLRSQNLKHSKPLSRQPSPSPPKKKLPKAARPFDSSKYTTRHIALKFAYLGGRYNGFEHHSNNATPLPTVEEVLWRELRKTKLISPAFREGQDESEVSWDGLDYSKCGRTDRGVSAFGQVISLKVRSNRPKPKTEDSPDAAVPNGNEQPADASEYTTMLELVSTHEPDSESDTPSSSVWDPIKDELPYIQLLNRRLPPDIRILAWCPNPPPDFSARFHCKERRYRYFFTNPPYIPHPQLSSSGEKSGWLDIEAMKQAAKKLEGLHDFRNFCKVDPSKQISNFQRRIFRADVHALHSDHETGAFLSSSPFTSSEFSSPKQGAHDSSIRPKIQLYFFEIRGSAFLWHQVRHMVAILFLVGQGYEDPSIVDQLLDTKDCPSKPVYEMADDLPLVLWDCIFPDPEKAANGDHTSMSVHGYEDALDWIYVGDYEGQEDGTQSHSGVLMQDRKYGRMGIMEDLWTMWRRRKIDEVLADTLMGVVARQGRGLAQIPEPNTSQRLDASARVFDGSGTPRTVGKYIPIIQRSRMETPEVQNALYAVRKGLNGTSSINGDAV